MRRSLVILLVSLASLLTAASAAQAVVVNVNGSRYGVALIPSQRHDPLTVPAVISSGPCTDPWLASDLVLPSSGLCWHGGGVLHRNETFAFTWDPLRRYWQTTRNFVEQFLSNVAKGSGTLSSPFALTGQYGDTGGRAANTSLYGGGCIDFGQVGGASCQYGSASGTASGRDYPANGCSVMDNAYGSNNVCLTDAQVQDELQAMIPRTFQGHAQSGYTPLVDVLLPQGTDVCLDSAGTICSANSSAPATFCSYHGQVNVGGTEYAYVVQPWTTYTSCDEPDVPKLPDTATTLQIAIDAGNRLVSPLSQSQIAAIVNPWLDGWFALDGRETSDNGPADPISGMKDFCAPLAHSLDVVNVGGQSYWLQREFNNAGVIETDPNAQACSPSVLLDPTFVPPSAVKQGDVVEFDGSTTVSSLIIPRGTYVWNFGDGTTGVGPSVIHTYSAAGDYSVTLTVIDRGGNVANVTEPLVVGSLGGQTGPPGGWHAHLTLVPQGLGSVLSHGVAVRVSSNVAADGIATLLISRKAARRAHIRAGHAASVVIARGTVSGIKPGTMSLHLRLSRSVARKLRHAGHIALTVRILLTSANGAHLAIDAAGRY